jgi:glycerol-3-phosphate acyltransferase PlsY
VDWLYLALLLVGSYLVGAIPSGVIVGRIFGRNPLETGSGKTGATNTLRAAGPVAAALVFALDLLKGAVVVLAAQRLPWPGEAWQDLAVGCAGAAAIVGHNWSIWVRLYSGKWGGGRGIVTALGAVLVVNYWIVLAALLAGGIVLLLTRNVTLGAIAGALGGFAAVVVFTATGRLSPWLLPGMASWCLLVVLGFHDHIGPLLSGTETRLGRE